MSINQRWEKDKQCNTKNKFTCAFTRGCSWDHGLGKCRIHEEQNGQSDCTRKRYWDCIKPFNGCTWFHTGCYTQMQRGGYEKDTMSKSKVKYNNKTRKVSVDNQGHRYIRMNGEIVYLKTIRGQYRYL
jgi:hypothetical protein